jgi:hypothetical protein
MNIGYIGVWDRDMVSPSILVISSSNAPFVSAFGILRCLVGAKIMVNINYF